MSTEHKQICTFWCEITNFVTIPCTKNYFFHPNGTSIGWAIFAKLTVVSSRHRPHFTGTSAGFWLRGSMPPWRLRRRKFDYEMVHSEVYLKKICGQHIAPFSTFACPNINIKTALFWHVFRLIFHPFFRGSADPICPYVRSPMTLYA